MNFDAYISHVLMVLGEIRHRRPPCNVVE